VDGSHALSNNRTPLALQECNLCAVLQSGLLPVSHFFSVLLKINVLSGRIAIFV